MFLVPARSVHYCARILIRYVSVAVVSSRLSLEEVNKMYLSVCVTNEVIIVPWTIVQVGYYFNSMYFSVCVTRNIDSILDYTIYARNEVIIVPCQVGYYFDYDVNPALVYRMGIYATITDI